MSGFLSGVARAGAIVNGVGQAVQNLAGLIDGGGVAPGVISIGGVVLHEFEIPDRVPWGSEQTIVTHRFPGGAKVMQMMGSDYLPVTWSGQMLGPDAVSRAQLLEQLVIAAEMTPLIFGEFQYTVIVKRFRADYRNAFWMGEYTIECETLPDQPDPDQSDGDPVANSSSALGSALGDIGNAIGDVANTAEGIISTGQSLLNSVGSIVTPITNALGIQVPWLSSAQGILNTASGAVGALGGLAAGASAVGGAVDTLSDAYDNSIVGMQASGGALDLANTNAGDDMVSPDDVMGATTAAGIQAGNVGAAYSSQYSQQQLQAAYDDAAQTPVSPAEDGQPANPSDLLHPGETSWSDGEYLYTPGGVTQE